jgi:hypothetical protein
VEKCESVVCWSYMCTVAPMIILLAKGKSFSVMEIFARIHHVKIQSVIQHHPPILLYSCIFSLIAGIGHGWWKKGVLAYREQRPPEGSNAATIQRVPSGTGHPSLAQAIAPPSCWVIPPHGMTFDSLSPTKSAHESRTCEPLI